MKKYLICLLTLLITAKCYAGVSKEQQKTKKNNPRLKQAKLGWQGYFATPASNKPWSIIVGGAIIVLPRYKGSSSTKVLPVPSLQATYKNRLFLSTYQGVGVFLHKSKLIKAGIALNYRFASNNASKNQYSGFNKVNNYLNGNIFLRSRWRMFSLSSSFKKSISEDYGSTWRASLGVAAPISKYIILSIGPSLTWSSAKAMQINYGVSPEESINSGLAAHKTHAEISNIGFNSILLMFYGKWFGQGIINGSWTQNEAATSPLTKHKFAMIGIISLGYRLSF